MRTFPQSGEVSQVLFPQHGEGHSFRLRRILPVMGNNLKNLRLGKRWTHQEAADAMGMSRGQFIKLERGERRLTSDYIEQAAEAFGVPAVMVIAGPETVPLVGYVGAGAQANFYGDGQEPREEVPAVEGASAKTVAVEIRGSSLGPLFDRWLCYYDDRRDPPTTEMLGKLCIVGLADGRVLVKQLGRGRTNGYFDLWSNNEPPIHDAAVMWAATVTAIRPR